MIGIALTIRRQLAMRTRTVSRSAEALGSGHDATVVIKSAGQPNFSFATSGVALLLRTSNALLRETEPNVRGGTDRTMGRAGLPPAVSLSLHGDRRSMAGSR